MWNSIGSSQYRVCGSGLLFLALGDQGLSEQEQALGAIPLEWEQCGTSVQVVLTQGECCSSPFLGEENEARECGLGWRASEGRAGQRHCSGWDLHSPADFCFLLGRAKGGWVRR